MKLKKQLLLMLYMSSTASYCLADNPKKTVVNKPSKVEELKIPQFEKDHGADTTIALDDLTAPMHPGSQGKLILKIAQGTKLTIKPSQAFSVISTDIQDTKATIIIKINNNVKNGMVPVEVSGDKDGVTHNFKTFMFVEAKK